MRGVVESREGAAAVVSVGGVGLRVHAPTSTLAKIGTPGETATFHTYLYVREDQLSLYGFATEDERRAFELLITVNGVGPKGALGILSALSLDQLRGAISGGNEGLLTVVPGIGKRIASRIVIDLKDKLGPRGTGPRTEAAPGTPASIDEEVIEALTGAFGYNPLQAAQAVASLGPEPAELQERVRAALKYFSAGR